MIALDLQNGANTVALLADALNLAEREHRDDLIEFFERRAERTDENGHVLIRVDTLVDLILDNTELAALIRPESIRSATPPDKGIAPAATGAIQKEGRQAHAQLN